MMARSKSSNQRPDTLTQDRLPPDRRKPLATRGRTIHHTCGSIATVSRCPRYVRFSSDSDQIADVPTRRIKCAPAARETPCEPQVRPCAEQRSRTSRTRAPVALTDPSEPWWTKPVHALQLQGLSWACDHRPWSCERVLYSSRSPSWSRRGGPQRLFQAVAIRRSISASVRCSLDLNSAFGRRRGILTVRFAMAGGVAWCGPAGQHG